MGSRFCFSGDIVRSGSLRDDFCTELEDPATWYLVDGMAPTELAARTFATVYKHEHYWNYLKAGGGRLEMNVRVLFMPVWGLGELLRARELIFYKVPEQLVKELYVKWGGNPRHVLQFARDKQQQRDLNTALRVHDFKTLLMEAGGSLETADEYSHSLLHWDVFPNLKDGTVVFASKYVAQEIMGKRSRVDVAYELSSCMGIRLKASFAAAAFEAFFHNLMKVFHVC